MTLDEMRDKWCPFMRIANQGGAYNVNADGTPIRAALCVGEKCMSCKEYSGQYWCALCETTVQSALCETRVGD